MIFFAQTGIISEFRCNPVIPVNQIPVIVPKFDLQEFNLGTIWDNSREFLLAREKIHRESTLTSSFRQ